MAPKGTGKSYVFGHVSKYGLLVDGGKITRTKMFYDANRRKPGYICGPDFLAIDEVKLVNFGDENEMRSILQDIWNTEHLMQTDIMESLMRGSFSLAT